MGILFVNIFFAAFKDGLSPAMIMASALVIAVYLFGWYKGFKVNLFLGICVIEIILLGFFAHLNVITINDAKHIMALYRDVIAGAMLVLGVVLVWDRILLVKGRGQTLLFSILIEDKKAKFSFWQKQILSVFLMSAAISLTAKDVAWPMDAYMVALSNNIFADVASRISVLSLCLYTIFKFWMIWIVIYVFTSTSFSRSLKLMIASAFFLAVGLNIFVS